MDAYARLRPYTEDSPCDCATVEQLLLVHILTSNPIRCFQCKGFVDPERLALSESQVEAVASWHSVFGALYALWLDSTDYETWAEEQLLRSRGRVNTAGMAAREALAATLPTFYWWFHNADASVPEKCPWCGGGVSPAVRHGNAQCDSCSIMV
jgi:hypothetical protein